ncbi:MULTISPECIES: hypothetical protein [Herbaspirillum]|uniref:hypothetical protein n=1 Tax=Herbaspirillum TaxID=963 RepID=UPI002176CE8B|nr:MULTISPECIES: hypothetical protein [Herbaspirillum]UWE19314.1 hypothetical protein NY669_26925 [Herbaspirillum huttiense]
MQNSRTVQNGVHTAALDARALWALAKGAKNPSLQEKMMLAVHESAGYAAKESEAFECPALLSPVSELRHAWEREYTRLTSLRAALRTTPGITQWLNQLAAEARRVCGMSFGLYCTRFSEAVDARLQQIEPTFRDLALRLAKETEIYLSREEREQQRRNFEASGVCTLTGIDPDCCPCGNHP